MSNGIEKRLRDLLRASNAVVSVRDMDGVLAAIVESAVEVVGADYCSLAVLDSAGGVTRFHNHGIAVPLADSIDARPGMRPIAAVLTAAGAVNIADISVDRRFAGLLPPEAPMRRFAGVAVHVRGEVFGNLYVAGDGVGEFADADMEMLEALASTAGTAIDNARHVAEVHARSVWSALTAELSTMLLDGDTAPAVTLMLDRVGELTDSHLVAVVEELADGTICIDVARGPAAADLEGMVFPAADSILADVQRAGGRTERHTSRFDATTFGPTVAVPLASASGRPAALLVARPQGAAPFPGPLLDRIEDLAIRARASFEVARARTDRERMSILDDRMRIARDLHDHVIQRLFGAGLGLQAIEASTTDPHVRSALPQQIDALDESIAEIRSIIFALRRVDTTGASLRHRLLDLVEEFEPHLVHAPRMTFGGTVDLSVPAPVADDVVAVVREGLSNIVRHAHARHVRIVVRAREHDVLVEVSDDGVGIPTEPERRSGVSNLAARAAAHGGSFGVEPGPGGGTVLRWTASHEESA